MKISKVYLRIFLSFLVMLVITEIIIFAFFVTFAGRKLQDYFREYNDARFEMAKEVTEYQLKKNPINLTQKPPAFEEFIDHLGLAFKTQIWITDSSNRVLFHSFEESFPEEMIGKLIENKKSNDFGFKPEPEDFYRKGYIDPGNGELVVLHMLFDHRLPITHLEGFALGLIMIGFFVALLTFPLARKISKPIKILTDSTKKLEKGDLSHRTKVINKDEIGELATAFNKMAEKLERMVRSGKEMTAQVSHELRSPLARIQIAVELLKDRLQHQKDEESNNQLKNIQLDVEDLDRIIGRILELSKLDLQNDVPYSEVFSPVKTLVQMRERYDSLLKNKKITVEENLENEAKVIGNKDALGTVYCNLLDNASRYTPTQGRIKLSSLVKEELLMISIENSGRQLPEVELQQIFDPFVRFDTNGENGAGLGLSIAKKIVEKHAGYISASNTDSGFKISVCLPVVRVE